MKVLRRLYRYLRHYKAWATLAFGSMIMFSVTTTAMIGLLQPIFDIGFTPPKVAATARKTLGPSATVHGGSSASQAAGPSISDKQPAAAPPSQPSRISREEQWKKIVIDTVLKRDLPEGRRGWIVNHIDQASSQFHRWWDPAGQKVQFRRLLAAMLIVMILRTFASFFSEYAFQKVGLSTVRDLRNELYERLIYQSHRFFSERSTGEMVSRVVSDADAIQAAVSTRMGDLFQESLTLFFLLVYVFWAYPELALITFIAAPLIVYPVVHFGKRLRGTTHRSQERMADMATLLEETIRGVRIVKAFTMERFEIGRFRDATKRHLSSNMKAQKIQALSSPVLDFITALGGMALFVYAQRRIGNGTLTVGALMAYIAAVAAMYQPMKKLNKVNLSVNTALSAAERVFRMLDIPNEVEDKPKAATIGAVGSGIRYENVSFQYQEEPVLRGVDLTVAPGEIVALVGGSGAGKSTFVNLLPRFYDVNGGRITIDGHDIRDVQLSSLRGLMGLVTQEVVLFNDTVRNNIAYGLGDAQEDRVIEAAKAANAHDFIMAMPHGYDTEIGESGVLLSGGQRQRLAIARALFKDPPILILDEATSALDTESERLVQGALERLMQGRTTLVIAHRLSTIRSADKIVVLDRGAIVETGPHEDLLARRGIYRKLYDLQFADDAVPTGAIA
ncbi:MAG TPA: ABC transporter transmembrane domain-containing protein [Thermoanaerobaculia bacterium]